LHPQLHVAPDPVLIGAGGGPVAAIAPIVGADPNLINSALFDLLIPHGTQTGGKISDNYQNKLSKYQSKLKSLI
jgi:hypothetical protein